MVTAVTYSRLTMKACRTSAELAGGCASAGRRRWGCACTVPRAHLPTDQGAAGPLEHRPIDELVDGGADALPPQLLLLGRQQLLARQDGHVGEEVERLAQAGHGSHGHTRPQRLHEGPARGTLDVTRGKQRAVLGVGQGRRHHGLSDREGLQPVLVPLPRRVHPLQPRGKRERVVLPQSQPPPTVKAAASAVRGRRY